MGVMLCAYCGDRLVYPDDFPVLGYAKCKNCYEKDEQEFRASFLGRVVIWLRLRRLLRM